jgi:hypothetical protein
VVVLLILEEIGETRIIQIMAAQEVIVVAAATTITIEVEVVVHIEVLVEVIEEMEDLGQVIHHQLVAITA